MRITIGITSFNEGDYLFEAWNSVIEQMDNGWEAVMILDGKKKYEQCIYKFIHVSAS